MSRIINNAADAVAYLNSVDWRGSRLGLGRMREFCARLGDPQKKLRFIHVAGTNGKGSTCAMLASCLQAAGYVTGLYTSPYVLEFNERIRVDGNFIRDWELADLTKIVAEAADGMQDHPTTFEMITALGFLYFVEKKCDIAVLEVGLGGRLDATNVIDPPEVSVITNIGIDHSEILGDTPEKIALEKFGIIKGGTVVCYDLPPGVMNVLKGVCGARGAELVPARRAEPGAYDSYGQSFTFGEYRDVKLRLLGEHQIKNAEVALTALERLKDFRVPEEAVRKGMEATEWTARLEVLRREPLLIADGGHNPQCAETTARALERHFPGKKFDIIFGVMKDKDYRKMLKTLRPLAKKLYTVNCRLYTERALPARELREAANRLGFDDIGTFAGVIPAGDALITGSLYITGEIINDMKRSP